MRDEAARMIDRLDDDVNRLNATVEEAWAILNEAGVDVQLVDTLADGVRKLVADRDAARLLVEQTMQAEFAVRAEWADKIAAVADIYRTSEDADYRAGLRLAASMLRRGVR